MVAIRTRNSEKPGDSEEGLKIELFDDANQTKEKEINDLAARVDDSRCDGRWSSWCSSW